jgi:hypothetical protein
VDHFAVYCITGIESEEDDDDEDEAEDVVNVEFSLGYGGKILLHNTRLWLKRGRRYGIVGKVCTYTHTHTHTYTLCVLVVCF